MEMNCKSAFTWQRVLSAASDTLQMCVCVTTERTWIILTIPRLLDLFDLLNCFTLVARSYSIPLLLFGSRKLHQHLLSMLRLKDDTKTHPGLTFKGDSIGIGINTWRAFYQLVGKPEKLVSLNLWICRMIPRWMIVSILAATSTLSTPAVMQIHSESVLMFYRVLCPSTQFGHWHWLEPLSKGPPKAPPLEGTEAFFVPGILDWSVVDWENLNLRGSCGWMRT